ncbi:MAG: hypothetical protein K9H25_14535 [Rhodospirillum sp.]|nr:hypothetical protein [Rhodospirillum sp.]MCF8491266.1 hypothetical protein [Rhodospirillum sp.]MCF8502913.1 hypothetical protein [Rhodospirillum sp.]
MSTLIPILIKFALMFAIVSAAIHLLSGVGKGEDPWADNRKRGWLLVSIVTVTAVAMAWFM